MSRALHRTSRERGFSRDIIRKGAAHILLVKRATTTEEEEEENNNDCKRVTKRSAQSVDRYCAKTREFGARFFFLFGLQISWHSLCP